MKKLKPNQKRLLLSLLVLALTVGGVYAYSVWQLTGLNTSYYFDETPDNLIASFHTGKDNSMCPIGGNTVYFDLGSRHSLINRSSLRRMEEQGYPVKSSRVLMWTTDEDGRFMLFTQKVKTDISIPNPKAPDSLVTIHDVELLVVDDDKPNTFGMDMMRQLVIERLWPEQIVNIYKEVPAGYHKVIDVDVHDSHFGNYIGSTGRASVKLTVNDDQPRDYFFDTGGNMIDVEVVQPLNQMHMATTAVAVDSLTGLHVQRQCRVAFGDRLRYSSVVYCDTLHTDEYSVNPFKLFDQDFLLDLPGRRLLIHKTRQ
ncbi:MAG: hypothetical protein K2F58_02330 [Muribaculaceae bacterium]|nr:hypothetical protein [Muribaculaceae bacterium]